MGGLGIAAVVAAGALGGGSLVLSAGAGTSSHRTVFRDRADVPGPLDLSRVTLAQRGRGLAFSIQVRGKIVGSSLGPLPKPGDATPHYLCLSFHRDGSSFSRQLCLGRKHGPWKAGVEKVGSSGRVRSAKTIAVKMLSVKPDKLRALIMPTPAGLGVADYRVHATSAWSGPACSPTAACRDRAPSGRSPKFELLPVRLAGCSRAGIGAVRGGPAGRHQIALTFDDGPSIYTPRVLAILRHAQVHATFFEVGDQIPGRSAIMNQILDQGNELGDHTLHHSAYPGYGDIRADGLRIHAATGFYPCLFRPPYGSYNSGTVAAAKRAGMSTIVWDVDPRDWSRPGTSAIYSRVVSATHSGSIVLMHDGGGDRSETVAALPRIISTFKARGYRMVTVSQLLGQPMRWRPVR